MSAKVINIRKKELQKIGYQNLEQWLAADPKHVYIGRNMTHYVPGSQESIWANPFPLSKYTREESLELYRHYVLTSKKIHKNGKTLLQALPTLQGTIMGCWCAPAGCHGHVLLSLLDTIKDK